MRINEEESIYGAMGDPLDYPSTLRDGAYFIDGSEVVELEWTWSDPSEIRDISNHQKICDRSDRARVAIEGLENRVPQIAFGANRDIVNVAWKFANFAVLQDIAPEPFVVLSGAVPNASVAMCNIGYWGYIYAALMTDRSDDEVACASVQGTAAPVSVLLLTPHQMRMMHESEGVPKIGDSARRGVSCDVALLDVDCVGLTLTCQMYGLPLPYLSFDRTTPVLFPARSGVSRPTRRAAQLDAWNRIIDHPAVAQFLRNDERTVDGLIELLRDGARRRMGGGSGSHDRAQDVYEHIRQAIIDEMHVQKADGSALMPTDGLQPLGPEAAWELAPTLAGVFRR